MEPPTLPPQFPPPSCTPIPPTNRKRKITFPPEGYTCHLCGQTGHWIFQCTKTKTATDTKNRTKRKRKTSHTPVPGVDPSPTDISLAREMQKIPPPLCFCNQTSRLKKVKRSNVSATSRANGNYFFFCAAKRREEGCRFARPVEHEVVPKSERICPFWARTGSCKKGKKCAFRHVVVAGE